MVITAFFMVISNAIFQQLCEIERWCQWITCRKPYDASPMVTWPMTSHDPKGQGRDPKIEAPYLRNRAW